MICWENQLLTENKRGVKEGKRMLQLESVRKVIQDEFERFQQGIAMDDIVADIISAVQGGGVGKGFRMSDIFDFARMKNRIILRVVNTETNRHMLDNIPHKTWMDLSVIYYLLLGRDTEGQTTTLISLKIVKEWGVKAGDLYDIAHENTKRLLPVNIRNMSEIMAEILAEKLGEDLIVLPSSVHEVILA